MVVRADSSGTTFVFTKHLSAVNQDFGKSVGINNMPNWPVVPNRRVTKALPPSLMTTPGSIGYIEYGYAESQKLPMATLQNKAGNFVAATTASAAAALAAEMPADLIAWVSDPEVRRLIRLLPLPGCCSTKSTITKPSSMRFAT